jgi:hypothetical protein
MFGIGNSSNGPQYGRVHASSVTVTPIASSVIIKSLTDMQSQLASAIDTHVAANPPPGPKAKDVSPELIEAWRQFPRSCDWYGKLLTRLADISASVDAEQAVAELVLQWLPPSIGASQPGSAFARSQFDFMRFTNRLKCLDVSSSFGGANRKEVKEKQDMEKRNMQMVEVVVCIAVCDILAALLNPRPGRMGTPVDPDIGHVCVQLAFGQFDPSSKRAAEAAAVVHSALAAPLHHRTVVSWAGVVAHLAFLRFDHIVTQFQERIHAAKTADEGFHILVGVQRVTIPHLSAPSTAPFFDQFRQIAISKKPLYKSDLMRLCVLYSIELLVRQVRPLEGGGKRGRRPRQEAVVAAHRMSCPRRPAPPRHRAAPHRAARAPTRAPWTAPWCAARRRLPWCSWVWCPPGRPWRRGSRP